MQCCETPEKIDIKKSEMKKEVIGLAVIERKKKVEAEKSFINSVILDFKESIKERPNFIERIRCNDEENCVAYWDHILAFCNDVENPSIFDKKKLNQDVSSKQVKDSFRAIRSIKSLLRNKLIYIYEFFRNVKV